MFQLALGRTRLDLTLSVAADGQEAIDYLSGQSHCADRAKFPLPDLLVLDLKMPRMSGFDVLRWLASRPDLSHIPAVVLSSSSYEEDLHEARGLGAAEYYVKPSSTSELVKLVKVIANRWLTAASIECNTNRAAES